MSLHTLPLLADIIDFSSLVDSIVSLLHSFVDWLEQLVCVAISPLATWLIDTFIPDYGTTAGDLMAGAAAFWAFANTYVAVDWLVTLVFSYLAWRAAFGLFKLVVWICLL